MESGKVEVCGRMASKCGMFHGAEGNVVLDFGRKKRLTDGKIYTYFVLFAEENHNPAMSRMC